MDPFYIVIIIVLGVLAVADLAVGVANDAVNFLNASLGTKVAPHHVILIVASVGIIIGAITSNGMMEVARNGVFHPGAFTFSEIMVLFGSMMLADVLLLNTFNRLGLPTSTTVSLVFELLGAAVAVALFHIYHSTSLTVADLGNFINSGKALVIISGILLSVVIAFAIGAGVMFFSRLLFSFRYKKAFRHFGAVWCGLSFAGIIYFALFKGLKESGIVAPEFTQLVNDNLAVSLLIAWAGSSILLGLLQLCRVKIMKVTILAGTFALALAFAGNDLVNFIGVPLAGLDAFNLGVASGDMNMNMAALAQPANVSIYLLLLTGVIMVVTLFVSKDAMKVSATTINLSAAKEGTERFASSGASRNLVRMALSLSHLYQKAVPASLRQRINRQFQPLDQAEEAQNHGAAYDHIRAVVNLTCAAVLICLGTMLKLPLSTTYVVFMVAMGTSLADRAWGRDSAVYRITGVLVVISGWFVTALAGFTIALAVGLLMMWGKWIGLICACLLCGYILCANLLGKKRETSSQDKSTRESDFVGTPVQIFAHDIPIIMEQVSTTYNLMLAALYSMNRRELHRANETAKELYDQATARKANILNIVKSLPPSQLEYAQAYVQGVDYVAEITKALLHCTKPAFEHVDNNHRPLTPTQIADLKIVNDEVDKIFEHMALMASKSDYSDLDNLLDMRDRLFDVIADRIKQAIRRIKEDPEASTRAGALYFNILAETKTLVLQARNLAKSQAALAKV